MQQTGKYQFNLIETSDAFSPDPLNENMEKVEAQFDAARAEAAAGDEALDQRVTALEARPLVTGTYEGTNGSVATFQVVKLGFTPRLVAVYLAESAACFSHYLVIGDGTLFNSQCEYLRIVEGGFQVNSTLASKGKTYYYMALA